MRKPLAKVDTVPEATLPVPEPESSARGEKTKKTIKRAIARLASRQDLSEITLQDICKAAKVTSGAVYFHFAGKDEAVEAMVIDEVRALYADLLAHSSVTGFRALVIMILERQTSYHRRTKKLALAIAVAINQYPRAYEVWIDARRPLIALLEQAILQERRDKGLATDSAAYLAHLILTSIEDLSIDVFQWQNPTLLTFAQDIDQWNRRQAALWSWAILAPFDPDPSAG